MNVLFFCHEDFACNSMGHIAGFAAGLRLLGHDCAAAIPGDDRQSAAALGSSPSVRPFLYSDTLERPGELFANGGPADLIHAWTPRENVRQAAEACRRKTMPKPLLVIHLEDNEEHLAATIAGIPYDRLRAMPDDELARRLPANLSHPREYPRFLRSADGVTGIVERLRAFAPRSTPFAELWPAVDFSLYHPAPSDPTLRASLGLRPEEKVICYPGNSHFANREELQRLYDAVDLLNAGGRHVRLLRTGIDTVPFPIKPASPNVLHLGFVDRPMLPALLRLADVLVQPGRDDVFDRYRLPSKLPEFLASGRPVLLPRTNLGLRLRHDHEALLLDTGSAEEIAAGCERIFTNPELADRVAEGAAAFARRCFAPGKSAAGLDKFYRYLQRPWSRLLHWWRMHR